MKYIAGIIVWTSLFGLKDYIEEYYSTSLNVFVVPKYLMSNLHSITSILLAFHMLTGNRYMEETEGVLISSMMGYFLSDLYHILKAKRYDMFFHHILCSLALQQLPISFSYNNPYISNIIAKGTLLEISTPYLNMYKSSKNPLYGVLLLISFFMFRIVWLTYIFSKIMFNVPDSELRPRIKAILFMFVLLNYYWYTKMLMIARYKFRKELKNE